MENIELKKFCEQNNIDLLVLFGSEASGKTHPASDIDVALKFNGEAKITRLELIYHLGNILNKNDVDVVIITPYTDPLLLYEIFFNGRPLYEKINGIFNSQKLRAWNLYIDTKKLRAMQKKYLKEFAERIANVS